MTSLLRAAPLAILAALSLAACADYAPTTADNDDPKTYTTGSNIPHHAKDGTIVPVSSSTADDVYRIPGAANPTQLSK